MDRETAKLFRAYRRELEQLYQSGYATEHSYRPTFQLLLQGFGGEGVRALNEPTHIACGAPDFIVERAGIPIGHVECKNIGVNLNRIQNNMQLTRYRDGLSNLILTDYLEFRWFVAGKPRITTRIGHLSRDGKIVFDQDGANDAMSMFDSFFSADPVTVLHPRDLAERMAAKARLLREAIKRILRQEGASGPLHELWSAYRKTLIGDLSASKFADLQAQTATYGLFAARCQSNRNSGEFTRKTAVFAETTPFLRDVFGRIAGPGIDSRIAWIVDDLALLLARADIAQVLADFGRRTRREDPVFHFYEDFLAAYDPKLREVRGVYYTPEPVVSYIVSSVDKILRSGFGLADGLADTSTITTSHTNTPQRQSPRVLILDPAVGTGTFLREVVATIRSTIQKKGLRGAWTDYVHHQLLPRLYGFELLMAPYAICHLKLALEIGERSGTFRMPGGQRLGVFLTNTLEEAHEGVTGALFAHEIARESAGADAVKRNRPVMVVLGNPPYSGHSANKGPWIKKLIDHYKHGFPELKKPGQAKWLSDDYVKFIRFAQWRIERTGEGVLAFVTNHRYLENPTFRGMRRSLMDTFDDIYVLDLHGNANRKERAPDGGKDENVFDIVQGVAIGLFVKHSAGSDDPARVFHADLWGRREKGSHGGKYGWLNANDVTTTEWTQLAPKAPYYLFAPRDETFLHEYESAWSIPAIFSPNGNPAPGIVTTHDQFAISWSQEDATSKVERLLASESETEARNYWRLCKQDQWSYERAKKELADDSWRTRVEPILYRPFDLRTTIFDRNVAVHRRKRVMQHMLAGTNIGLSTTRATEIAGGWEHVFVSRNLVQHHTVSIKEINYLFPLYRYTENTSTVAIGEERLPNIDADFINSLSATFGLKFILEGVGDLKNTFGPEDVFSYIYSILHSPKYRQRFADFLKSDFPRIPMTNDIALFKSLVGFGNRLIAVHLMDVEGENKPHFPETGKNVVERVRYSRKEGQSKGKVWINAKQYFSGVQPETWTFTIGGYKPAEKWLKDRKGLVLSFEDITHYQRICAALAETRQVMGSIDEQINSHGGWPLS